MFDTTSSDLYYMSNPDLLSGGEGQDNESIDFENQRILDMENLVTINNKTGQKYAWVQLDSAKFCFNSGKT